MSDDESLQYTCRAKLRCQNVVVGGLTTKLHRECSYFSDPRLPILRDFNIGTGFMQALLKVLHRDSKIEQVNLLPSTLIGRSMDCDLRIASSHVSRLHCRIELHADKVLLEDLGSANGTQVNDEMVPPRRQIELQPGDRLTIGPAEFRIEYQPTGCNTVAVLQSAIETQPISPQLRVDLNNQNRGSSQNREVPSGTFPPFASPTDSVLFDDGFTASNHDLSSVEMKPATSQNCADFAFLKSGSQSTSRKPHSVPVKKTSVLMSLLSVFRRQPKPIPQIPPATSSVADEQQTCEAELDSDKIAAGTSSIHFDESPLEVHSKAPANATGEAKVTDDNFQKFLRKL